MSAFYNARQGYPFEAAVHLTNPIVLTATGQTVTTLPNGGGTPTIILDNIGENRLPTFQNLDFHVERPVTFGSVHFVPSMDIFNVTNNNTIQALAAEPERGERQPHSGDRGPAGHPVRCSRELVNRFVREERKGRAPRGPGLFFNRGASPLGLPDTSLARRFAGALRSRGSLATARSHTATDGYVRFAVVYVRSVAWFSRNHS